MKPLKIYVRDLSKAKATACCELHVGADPVEVRGALSGVSSEDESAQDQPALSYFWRIYTKNNPPVQHRRNGLPETELRGVMPPIFTEDQRADIIELAQIPHKVLGYLFTHWSLAKLKEAA